MSAARYAAAPGNAAGRRPVGDRLPRPDTGWSLALTLVVVAGCVPVLYLWWQNAVPGALRTSGDVIAAAGRLLGLLAAYLLLVLVALMARVPWLENRVGSDVVARHHRRLGEYTITLAAAHAVLVVLGYAMHAHANPVSEAVTVVTSYTDVWLAAVALGLLLVVGAVSARAIRRRFSYETWYFAHLLVYAAIALAFSHEFAVGTEFSASARNRLLWSGAHVLVAAAVVAFRVVLPVVRSLRHDVRVAGVVREGAGVVSVMLAGRGLDRLRSEPGQFFRWRFFSPGLWWQSHPYSLSAVPTRRTMRITVKDLGDGSRSLAGLRPGTRVWFEGPYGAFTPRRTGAGYRPEARAVLLVAAGAGITPIRALFEALPGSGADVVLIYRASEPGELVLYHELEAIAGARGFALYPVVGSRRAGGGDPLTTRELRRLVPDAARREVYLCGPPGFVRAATRRLERLGVRRGRIHTEAFAW